ncbi:MAG: hypothetical protein EBY41_00025 [Proteobacteria bacterium]|jgi:hypothetical protein|nr:hypothetical protein [Pseudomonadota bacterium]
MAEDDPIIEEPAEGGDDASTPAADAAARCTFEYNMPGADDKYITATFSDPDDEDWEWQRNVVIKRDSEGVADILELEANLKQLAHSVTYRKDQGLI